MSRTMELALAIKGKVDGSVTSSVQKAISESNKLQASITQANKAIKETQKMGDLERKATGTNSAESQAKILELQRQASVIASQRSAKVREIKALETAAAQEAARSGTASLNTLNQLAAKRRELSQIELQDKKTADALKSARAAAKAEQLATGQLTTATQEKLNRLQNELNAATEKRNKILDAATAKETAGAKFSSALGNLGTGIAVTAAAAAPLAAMIGTAANFEQAMSKVKAITNSSNEDMARLTATAQELGSKTQFSASQAAEAMTYLGMAGWKTEQIISGMPGLLDLAAASGSNLATVADIVSDDLTAFGMSADQAGHMADVMAAASTNANTNVEMMGNTFKYAGAVAGSLGYSLEDVAVATGLMANAGIKGDQAGTSLRAIMTRLVAPTKQSGTAMDMLGISVTNADGTMKPFMQTMQEMRAAFSGLSDSEKAEKASMIAGQEAMSGFLAVINASDEDFNKLTSEINNCDGAAARMAKTMNDNAKGGAIQLQSAIEGVSIAVGNIFLPTLAEMARAVADQVGGIAKWAQEHQELVSMIIKATAAVAGFVLALLSINVAVAGVNWLIASLKLVGLVQEETTAGTIAASIANKAHAASSYASAAAQKVLTVATSAYGAALRALSSPLSSGIAGIKAMGTAIMSVARAGIGAMFSPLGLAIMAIAAAGYFVYSNWSTVGPMFEAMWANITTAFQNAWTMLQPAITQLVTTFSTIASTIGTALTGAFATISALFTENSATFAAFGEILLTLAGIIGGVVVGAIVIMAEVIASNIVTAINVATAVITMFMGVLDGIINFVAGVFTGNWQQAWDGVAQIFSSVWNGIKAVADSILSGIMGMVGNVASSIGSLLSSASNFVGGGNKIASNAEGGIYGKGAFLTTFAEEGPEAAIPLDGSARALSLWRQAGEMMGAMPTPQVAAVPVARSAAPAAGGDFRIELNAPITINGGASADTVAQLGGALQRLKAELAADFGRQFEAYNANRRRLSYE